MQNLTGTYTSLGRRGVQMLGIAQLDPTGQFRALDKKSRVDSKLSKQEGNLVGQTQSPDGGARDSERERSKTNARRLAAGHRAAARQGSMVICA